MSHLFLFSGLFCQPIISLWNALLLIPHQLSTPTAEPASCHSSLKTPSSPYLLGEVLFDGLLLQLQTPSPAEMMLSDSY